MQIVIDISENHYKTLQMMHECGLGYYNQAILNGTVLPKGHERLIDMKDLRKLVTDYCDAKQLILADREDYLPTIVEADKGE